MLCFTFPPCSSYTLFFYPLTKVVDGAEEKVVQLINRKSLRALTSQLLAVMMSLPDAHNWLGVEALQKQYESMYDQQLNPCEYGFVSLTELLKSLPYLVEVCMCRCESVLEC